MIGFAQVSAKGDELVADINFIQYCTTRDLVGLYPVGTATRRRDGSIIEFDMVSATLGVKPLTKQVNCPEPQEGCTASMSQYFCTNCGWPVIHACCNGTFTDYKDAKDNDWWMYCSNKGCKNHEGEGSAQEELYWCKASPYKQ